MKYGRTLLTVWVHFLLLVASVASANEGGGRCLRVAWHIGDRSRGMGGSIAQGRTAAAALEGIARNPAAQGNFRADDHGTALIESLVLYAFVIAFVKIKI